MEIRRINSEFYSNCYLLYNGNDVYIIDPSCKYEVIKTYLKEEDIVKGVLITHGHIDHIFYIEEIQKEFDCLVYMHKNCLELLGDEDKNCSSLFRMPKKFEINKEKIVFVSEGNIIDGLIKVLYTPGHSFDSLMFLVEDYLFTGDTLFKESIGRTDFYSGNLKLLSDSIRKIYSLKRNLKIYPGHEGGSDLEYEKLNNYYVKKFMA